MGAGRDGARVGEELGDPTDDGDGEADGLTDTDVGEAEGEGVAAAVQPPRSASDTTPTATRSVTVYERIAPHLREAERRVIVLLSSGTRPDAGCCARTLPLLWTDEP